MISTKKRYTGITLIETLLVLAIGSMILIMGMRQYQVYQLDSQIRQIKYNVDTIFQAMAFFYRANCLGPTDAYSGVILMPGKLNPSSPSYKDPFPINLQTDLVNGGFLSTTLPTIVALSPLVDSTGKDTNGYAVQFNRYTQDRFICTIGVAAASPNDVSCSNKVKIGTIVLWKAQVAVLMQDPAKAATYRTLLGGDCLSSYTGGGVAKCSAGAAGNYVVFERLPSFSSAALQTGYGLTNPTIQQFNQMYTTYPINSLLRVDPSTGQPGRVPAAGGAGTEPQYFLCNS